MASESTAFMRVGDGGIGNYIVDSPELGVHNLGDLKPFQIVSLLEMLKRYAFGFYKIGEILGILYFGASTQKHRHSEQVPADDLDVVLERIKDARYWSNLSHLKGRLGEIQQCTLKKHILRKKQKTLSDSSSSTWNIL